IDISLLDCVVAISSYQAINHFLSGQIPRRMGNAHSNMVPYQVFACRQGDVIVAVGNDGQFQAFCEVIGRPDLANDARYATPSQRNLNRDTLIPQIAAVMQQRDMADWVQRLEAANVPCGPINNLKQVFEDPHVQHRGMRLSLPHSAGVQAPAVANPMRLSATPIHYGASAPLLGEHTDAVLASELGLDAQACAALRAAGAI
ncbi:CaiB/BaiF CoA transferase family protein, partial [Castellaniella sp.]|uniref:CaiB/BaiF CoA transferase family protein n=1 Tax=Castellaniella sp. TaxID=1955812 RepID=UPI0035616D37